MSNILVLRAKYFLSEHRDTIAIVVALVGVIALATAITGVLASPQPGNVTVESDRQTVTTSLETSSVVTGESAMFDSGTRLENKPVYLTDHSPNLTLAVRTDVPDDVTATVTHRIVAVITVTGQGTRYWRSTRTLASNASRVTGETATTSTTFDVMRFDRQTVQPIRAEAEDVGSLSLDLRVVTSYETDRYEGQMTLTAPLRVSESTFAVERPSPASNTHSTTVERTETPEHDPQPPVFVRLAIALVAFGVATVVVYGPDEEDASRYREEIERERHGKWISSGTVPDDVGTQSITVSSLSDLVDVAIDTSKRVIHDEATDECVVVDGDTVYRYRPESPPVAVTADENEAATTIIDRLPTLLSESKMTAFRSRANALIERAKALRHDEREEDASGHEDTADADQDGVRDNEPNDDDAGDSEPNDDAEDSDWSSPDR